MAMCHHDVKQGMSAFTITSHNVHLQKNLDILYSEFGRDSNHVSGVQTVFVCYFSFVPVLFQNHCIVGGVRSVGVLLAQGYPPKNPQP